MSVTHQCTACNAVNDYDIELGTVVEHYNACEYDNKVVLKDLSIKIHPLTYKQWTEFQLQNFQLQRQLKQITEMTDEQQQGLMVNELYAKLTVIQQNAIFLQIASVDTGTQVVDEREFITEWLDNCDKDIFDAIKDKIEANRTAWEIPKIAAVCNACSAENQIAITMDQTSFFVKA
jgi:hypothetical protein